MSLQDAWDAHADEWVRWARAPGHDSYWRFHRQRFLALLPPPGRLTLDLGAGEGRLARDLQQLREVTEDDPTDRWYRIPLFLHLRAVLADRQAGLAARERPSPGR